MNRDALHSEVVGFISQRRGIPPGDVTLDTNFVESGLVDSLLIIELFFHVESIIGESIPTDGFRLDSFDTVRKIYDNYVSKSAAARLEGAKS